MQSTELALTTSDQTLITDRKTNHRQNNLACRNLHMPAALFIFSPKEMSTILFFHLNQLSSRSHSLAQSVKCAEREVTSGVPQDPPPPQPKETNLEGPVSASSTNPRGERAATATGNEVPLAHQETQSGLSTERTVSNHTATPLKPSAQLPPVQDCLKDNVETPLPTEILSEKNSSTETPLTEKTSVDTRFSTVPPSTVNPSAATDGTQQNCNSNNSQVKDDQAFTDTTLKNVTNINSGAHTDSHVEVHGMVSDEMVPESQDQNAKKRSSTTPVDSSRATESSLAGNSNTEMLGEPDAPDGAGAVDGSAPSNPPASRPKSHKLIQGRKKSNKEGNWCIFVCVFVCMCMYVCVRAV